MSVRVRGFDRLCLALLCYGVGELCELEIAATVHICAR